MNLGPFLDPKFRLVPCPFLELWNTSLGSSSTSGSSRATERAVKGIFFLAADVILSQSKLPKCAFLNEVNRSAISNRDLPVWNFLEVQARKKKAQLVHNACTLRGSTKSWLPRRIEVARAFGLTDINSRRPKFNVRDQRSAYTRKYSSRVHFRISMFTKKITVQFHAPISFFANF